MKVVGSRQMAVDKWIAFVSVCTVVVLSCVGDGRSSDPKFKQYYNQGEELYTQHCSNCHQKNGKGLGRIYPPLDSADFLNNNFNSVICLMRNGMEGSITVNQVEFNQRMPGIPTLSDLEIAEIATYIYNTWDNKRGLVDVKEVTPILQSCEKDL